ncbi:MAG: hypothetical protein RR945_07495 [Erysipelotrichaceae bacterium]
MIQDDYIIKMIREIGTMLSKLLFNKDDINQVDIQNDLDQDQKLLFNNMFELISNNTDIQTICQTLRDNTELSNTNKTKLVLFLFDRIDYSNINDTDQLFELYTDLLNTFGYSDIVNLFYNG